MVGDERKRAADSSLEVKLAEQAIVWSSRVAVGLPWGRPGKMSLMEIEDDAGRWRR